MRSALLLVAALGACSSGGRSDEAPGPTPPAPTPAPAPDPTPFEPPAHAGRLRALVPHPAPGDELVVALRLGVERSAAPAVMRSLAAIDPLVVSITGPDGAAREVRGAVKAAELLASSTPTLVLRLPGVGLDAPGVHHVGLTGSLIGAAEAGAQPPAPVRFTAPAIDVEVMADGRLALAEIRRRARAELDRMAPEVAKGVDGLVTRANGTESGFVPDVVVEDERGDRVVRFAVPRMWAYTLHSVTLAPDGRKRAASTRDVGTCIGAGTPVDGEHGPVPVERLAAGDRVWGMDPATGARVLTTVRSVHAAGRSPVLAAGALLVTPDHPVWIDGAWRPARALAGPAPLELRPAVPVHDVEVAPPHTFFAGGHLVHNKDRGYSPELDDPWLFLWNPP